MTYSMTSKIGRIFEFTHMCSNENEGFAKDVTVLEYESKGACCHCGEPLVTTRQMVAHIYSELLHDD